MSKHILVWIFALLATGCHLNECPRQPQRFADQQIVALVLTGERAQIVGSWYAESRCEWTYYVRTANGKVTDRAEYELTVRP